MKSKITIALLLVISGVFMFNPIAQAAIPTLTVSSANGNSVLVSVVGDSNSNIVLYYYSSGGSYSLQTRNIGTTDSSGHFSAYIDTYSYGVTSGNSVYVSVNGQQSNFVTWPYGGQTGGQISLSQTNLNLYRGEVVTVTVYGISNVVGYSSNSNVIGLNVLGNQLTITGSNSGTATVSVCDQNNQVSCATLYVTVDGGGSNNQNITFSQNNVSVYNGQPVNVSIYGGSNNYYYISTNSNPSAVNASISGSTIVLTAGTSSGTATISVCSQSYGCGSLFVTSNGGYGLGLIYPINFQVTNNVLNKTFSQYSYANNAEAQEGDIVEFEIRIKTNNYELNNYHSLTVDLKDNLPHGLTYMPGSTRVNGTQVVDGITSAGIYLNNFYPGQEQVVKFSAMVNSNLYSETLTNQLTATMNNNTQTASSYVIVRPRGTVLGAADVVTGPDGAMPLAVFFGLITAFPIYYLLSCKKFRRTA